MAYIKTDYPNVYQSSKTGKIQVHVSLGTDRVTGKRIRLKSNVNDDNIPFSSLVEAHKFVTVKKAKFYKSGEFSVNKITLNEFIEKEYLPYYKSIVKPQTYNHKIYSIKVIQKYFQVVRLRNIDIRMVHQFRIWLTNQEYKQSYSSGIFSAFKRIMSHAETLSYIEDNVSLKADALPKGRADVKYWTRKEFEKVLSTFCIEDIYQHLCYTMLILYFMTGLRVNEATVLYWEDLDVGRKQIYIGRNLVIKSKTEYVRSTDMKTKNAHRYISIDSNTLDVLLKWREDQKKIGLGRDNDFILSHDGYPMIRSTILHVIRRHSKLAGVHHIQAKGLRHSHVSYLINEYNIDILLISKRLGHSSPEITYRHYAHLYSGLDRDIANAIEGMVDFSSSKENLITFNGNQYIDSGLKSIKIVP